MSTETTPTTAAVEAINRALEWSALSSEQRARNVLDCLAEAGFAVVALPEADRNDGSGRDFWDVLGETWVVHADPEFHNVGINGVNMDPEVVAAKMAGALLAAAKEANRDRR